eukprot:TRINITY_DN1701_c0_g2_i1.p1 TRINITY_DN1701_c0_g2~~TRINITY_DN1701_c0_g2_i1.p1  ORF type:complete len:364 (-),score=51.65 TRINITY_DN1701_c0_g2_i1:243-1334(-)
MTFALLKAATLGILLHQASKAEEVPVPKGHLQPFGSWTEGTPVEERDDVPEPEDFYNLYSTFDNMNGKPVIFRGAAKKMATSRWGNDAEMMKKYGDIEIDESAVERTEDGLKVMRRGDPEEGLQTFGDFLSVYNTSEVYYSGESFEPLLSDQEFLPCLRCGGFLNFLRRGQLWMGRGGSRTTAHYDDNDNINCQVDGEKRIMLFDRKYKTVFEEHANTPKNKFGWVNHDLPGGEDFEGWGAHMALLDLDKVDLIRFPGWIDLEWSYADLKPGDCMYIPLGWLHHVIAKPGRSINFNSWYYRPKTFDKESCTKQVLAAPPPKFSDCTWDWESDGSFESFYGELTPDGKPPTECFPVDDEVKSEL